MLLIGDTCHYSLYISQLTPTPLYTPLSSPHHTTPHHLTTPPHTTPPHHPTPPTPPHHTGHHIYAPCSSQISVRPILLLFSFQFRLLVPSSGQTRINYHRWSVRRASFPFTRKKCVGLIDIDWLGLSQTKYEDELISRSDIVVLG